MFFWLCFLCKSDPSIKDDILITENGPVNLSADAPRHADEIEKLMKQSSALDDFKLPKLD